MSRRTVCGAAAMLMVVSQENYISWKNKINQLTMIYYIRNRKVKTFTLYIILKLIYHLYTFLYIHVHKLPVNVYEDACAVYTKNFMKRKEIMAVQL